MTRFASADVRVPALQAWKGRHDLASAPLVTGPLLCGGNPGEKGRMSVGVDGEGDAPLPYDPPEQEQVAYCGLPFLEDGVGCRPGRIIDRQMQGQYWAAILQPGMMAAIELEEHPRLGHALSAHPVSGTAVPWTWESCPHQQTPHRRTRYHQTLSLR